jgi:hypothetical protein
LGGVFSIRNKVASRRSATSRSSCSAGRLMSAIDDFTNLTDPTVVYPAVGRCIYCLRDGQESLHREHIIPHFLNGTQILPKAVCKHCGAIATYFEGVVANKVFHQLRAHARLRSRSGLPTHFPLILKFQDGHEERIMVATEEHPATLILPRFDPPTLLSGNPPDGNYHMTTVQWRRASQAHDDLLKQRAAIGSEVELFIRPQQFARFLAKIAHAYAVAQLGLTGFRPFLTDLILGRNVEHGPELIGGQHDLPPPASGILHELSIEAHPQYVVVRIRLFASSAAGGMSMPVYFAVAGESARCMASG